MTQSELERLDPGFREVGLEGAEINLNQYLDAVSEREVAGTKLNNFFEKYDLLLTPTLPITAFDAGVEFPKDSKMDRWTRWTPFSYPFNLGDIRRPPYLVVCARMVFPPGSNRL